MQKLVFTNGGGQSIDLTSGNFGITNWEGLSNTELNIQTQQVPFQDGGVFLDALMEQREISVTVAIQDNNDLSLRYELKRQLISALNPKLGEGVLVYTNDYLSRQIKAVPQLPIFENKNSNDAGTLKASVVFSCPSPYWEDLEETEVVLPMGVSQTIENEGDIPCGVKINIDSTQIGYPIVKNLTNGKKIQLEGLFGSSLKIDTDVGKKQVVGQSEGMTPQVMGWTLEQIQYNSVLKKYFATSLINSSLCYGISEDRENWSYVRNIGSGYNIAYSEVLGYFIQIGYYASYKSTDGINWEQLGSNLPFYFCSVVRVEEMGLFFAFRSSELYSSPNGEVWQRIVTPSGYSAFFGQNVGGKLYICSQGGDDCYIYDGNEFTQINLKPFERIQYISELGIYVAENRGNTYIQTSTDGITWTQVGTNGYGVNSIGWNGNKLLINASSGGTNYWLESTDGINITLIGTSPYRFYCLWFENGKYTGCGANGLIANSEDGGATWEVKKINPVSALEQFEVQIVSSASKTFILFENGGLLSSTDGINWKVENPNITLQHFEWIKEKNLFVGFNGSAIYTSTDGITWTSRKTTSSAGKFIYSKKLDKIVSVYGVYSSGTGKTTIHTLTSTDGITWTDTTGINFTGQLGGGIKNIAYSEVLGVFVAGFGNIWLRSTDGTNWTNYSNANVYINSLFRVDKDGYFYSFYEKMYKSADGITWTSTVIASDVYTDSGAYSEELGLYVVVGEFSSDTIKMAYFTSTDGTNWERKEYKGTGYRITTTGYSKTFKKFVTGNSKMVSVLMASGVDLNLISSMSADSDISLNLEVGTNNLICSRSSGYGTVKIKYRQKYIGV